MKVRSLLNNPPAPIRNLDKSYWRRFGRMSLLPVVLLMNLFIKLLNCFLDFTFDEVPEFWYWAMWGEFKTMSSEDWNVKLERIDDNGD